MRTSFVTAGLVLGALLTGCSGTESDGAGGAPSQSGGSSGGGGTAASGGAASGGGGTTGSGGASTGGTSASAWGCTVVTETCECYDDDQLPAGYEAPTCTTPLPCCVLFDVSNQNGEFQGCVCYSDAWLGEHATTCIGQRDSIEQVDMYSGATVTATCPP